MFSHKVAVKLISTDMDIEVKSALVPAAVLYASEGWGLFIMYHGIELPVFATQPLGHVSRYLQFQCFFLWSLSKRIST